MSDLIERQAAIDAFNEYDDTDLIKAKYVRQTLAKLPSVQPYTDEEIQKIQELEQAQLDKAFELGREDARAEIICCNECKHCRKGRRTDGEIIPE